MMRVLSIGALTITMGLIGSIPASATTIGPDAFGYTATDSVPYAFVDISATGTQVLPNVDDSFAPVPMGFTFNFSGTAYTNAFLSSNGLITFGAGNSAFTNTNLTAEAQASIAVLWDDWVTTGSADAVYYQTMGPAGDRQFIAQWNQVQGFVTSPSTVTFQAVLYESSGNILAQYLDVVSGDGRNNGASATVGIKDAGVQGGNRLLWSFNQNVIQNQQAILFSAPEPGTLALLGLGMAGAAYRRRRG